MTTTAICNVCDRRVTLVHPTKTYPEGSRLHRHNRAPGRRCHGGIKPQTQKRVDLQAQHDYDHRAGD